MRHLLSLFLLLGTFPVWAATAQDIIDKVDDLMNPEAKVTLRLEFKKNGRLDEEYRMTTYARDNNQKVIVRFTSPATSIGQDLIMLDRNVWLYEQKVGRTVRVPANLSFGGTGFSYGDIVRLNLKDNYSPTVKRETGSTWVLDLAARDRYSPYHKIELTVAKDGYRPIKAVTFSRTGKVIKEIDYKDVRSVNGRKKPTRLVVVSPLTPGEESTMLYVQEKRMQLPPRLFNRRNLALRLEERS